MYVYIYIYIYVFAQTALSTWLQKLSAYSAGHKFAVIYWLSK